MKADSTKYASLGVTKGIRLSVTPEMNSRIWEQAGKEEVTLSALVRRYVREGLVRDREKRKQESAVKDKGD